MVDCAEDEIVGLGDVLGYVRTYILAREGKGRSWEIRVGEGKEKKSAVEKGEIDGGVLDRRSFLPISHVSCDLCQGDLLALLLRWREEYA